MEGITWAHLAATLFMTGLIWYVQIVHYPLMGNVGATTFRTYQEGNMRRAAWVVVPPMVVEAVTAVALVFRGPGNAPPALAILGIGLLVVIWLSTAFIQVPLHRTLLTDFDAGVHSRLVATNWIRTAAWSCRSTLGLVLAAQL